MPFTFKDQITVEKSPNYFVDPVVPERVYKLNTSMKLLLILRDPVRRTISDYLQIMDNRIKRRKVVIPFETLVLNQETLEINQSYSAVKRSVYVRHLARWMQFFPLQQIHIVDGENLVLQPWQEMAKVEDFLGLEHQITEDKFTYKPEHGFYCYTLGEREQCLAESKGRKHPVIDSFVLKKLKDFFRNFNEKLFMRIGRRFDWN
ncbi:heparan sulfate glucosamine 3-O-sulfotransferase 5-like [Pomacea canaliculata]|uniref:heparan sulfate glucosamine 3-O-sulfotransferase 5-like n=1 Tax=Pomacea canaliculata TaxID=400727 RepID=UPI000D72AA5A|nr:heparan sulfate glucosamine 3-O-sulfotransferase 5-like [Pomacea canaliculata]